MNNILGNSVFMSYMFRFNQNNQKNSLYVKKVNQYKMFYYYFMIPPINYWDTSENRMCKIKILSLVIDTIYNYSTMV